MSQSKSSILTEQEIQILHWVRLGRTNQQIALSFGISTRTVEYHLGRIFKKLEVANRTAAVVLAEKMGILNENANG
ncbi:MAG: helix-turn-helix transcriptional regulator [Chloroflexi bacterium]|nr:helix-turn-helix transcriptional regulator [Chloroflexota bacterium]